MKTTVVRIQKIENVDPISIPDGDYKGNWGGYDVNVSILGTHYSMKTSNGIRTMNASCIVHVENGVITIELS